MKFWPGKPAEHSFFLWIIGIRYFEIGPQVTLCLNYGICRMLQWVFSNIELPGHPTISAGKGPMGKTSALESAMMTPEEKKSLRHSGAMIAILGKMVEHEDHYGTAMTQEQIVEAFKPSEFDPETVLFEMLDLAYVVCSVSVSPEQRSQNVQVASICYAWGTTFFGREWAKGLKERNAES
jgi:hypothetical protein